MVLARDEVDGGGGEQVPRRHVGALARGVARLRPGTGELDRGNALLDGGAVPFAEHAGHLLEVVPGEGIVGVAAQSLLERAPRLPVPAESQLGLPASPSGAVRAGPSIKVGLRLRMRAWTCSRSSTSLQSRQITSASAPWSSMTRRLPAA